MAIDKIGKLKVIDGEITTCEITIKKSKECVVITCKITWGEFLWSVICLPFNDTNLLRHMITPGCFRSFNRADQAPTCVWVTFNQGSILLSHCQILELLNCLFTGSEDVSLGNLWCPVDGLTYRRTYASLWASIVPSCLCLWQSSTNSAYLSPFLSVASSIQEQHRHWRGHSNGLWKSMQLPQVDFQLPVLGSCKEPQLQSLF